MIFSGSDQQELLDSAMMNAAVENSGVFAAANVAQAEPPGSAGPGHHL